MSPWDALVGCPVDGPPLMTFTMTMGVSVIAAYPMVSCMSENPGPDVAVIDFAPPQEAPTTADIHAISSSIWRKDPPTSGSLLASPSVIAVEGVIGYPAKNFRPAVIEASVHASITAGLKFFA